MMRLPALIFLLFLTSCTKEYLPDTYSEIPLSEPKISEYLPVYPDADAMLYSVDEVKFGSAYATHTGKARAFFTDDSSGFMTVGTVKVQDIPLKMVSHFYRSDPDTLNPGGISYASSGPHRWSVSGNDRFPEINFICSRTLPDIYPLVTTSQVIDRSQSFGVNIRQNSNEADSLRYTIFSTGGYLFANRSASSPLHVFTPDKLSQLSAGKGILRLTAFNVNELTVNGRKLVYINQSITEIPVEIK